MKNMKKLTIILSILLSTQIAFACSCEEPGSVEESYKYSDAVFYGKVLKLSYVTISESMNVEIVDSLRSTIATDERNEDLFNFEYLIKVEFELIKCYKGENLKDTVVIYTPRGSASCGFTRFTIGKEYIVYASSESYMYNTFINNRQSKKLEKENTYWTNHCTRTAEFDSFESNELESIKKE